MNLNQYLSDTGRTIADASRELEEPHENVRRWANGLSIPRPETVIKIEEWSGGQVRSADFYAAWAVHKRQAAARRREQTMNDAGADAAYRRRVLVATPAAS